MNRYKTTLILSLLPVFVMAETREVLPPLAVIGSQEAVRQQVGSAAFLTVEDIQAQNHFNVNRILARVPGVYLRDEDGFGNFPNISIRGVDGTRSEKLTVMEDGIPAAPAVYTAPAAYFTPSASRMSGIEILKGSSQVRFGPNTTGGVLNYLSTPIPDEPGGSLRYSAGSFNTHLLLLRQGGTVDQEGGRFGYLVEVLGQSSDGFRDLDGGGDTGFRRFEPMLKFSWEPNGPTPQRWELKFGHTDFNADETYLGLSESDVRATPRRRYVSTRFDNIDTEHIRGSLQYTASPSEQLDLESTVYAHRFTRRFVTGNLEHALTGGVRFHYDSEKRFQYVDVFQGDGKGDFSVLRRGVPGEEADRKAETFATAVFLEDSIRSGALTLRQGVRGEFLRMEDNNRGKSVDGLEMAGFHTDYQNLIGTDTGLGLADLNQNAGEATVYGVEASISVDPAARADKGYRLPLYISLTYTRAELDRALATGGADNIFAGGEPGTAIPYVPEWKLAAGIGFEAGPWRVNLDATWVDETLGTANEASAPQKNHPRGRYRRRAPPGPYRFVCSQSDPAPLRGGAEPER